MFTGIIEGLGEAVSLTPADDGKFITITLPFSRDTLVVGNSIAVNGVCLTLSHRDAAKGVFFLSGTTLETTNLNKIKTGDKVNLERPLRLNQELGGHIITGHVDTMCALQTIERQKMKFTLPSQITPYLIPKGSIAIDGISLTIASIDEDHFWVHIIPYTWQHTNLQFRKPGDLVNVESDLIGKYVWRIVTIKKDMQEDGNGGRLTLEKLQTAGFMNGDKHELR